jgi:hypothetical protein
MSDAQRANITIFMGVIGLLGTIAVQVYTTGSIKGMITTKLVEHDRRISSLEGDTKDHGRIIERISGRIGMTTSQAHGNKNSPPLVWKNQTDEGEEATQ